MRDQRAVSAIDGVGDGAEEAGSRTLGGNGSGGNVYAMKAPTPAHPSRIATHTSVLAHPRTPAIISQGPLLPGYRPRPVISALSVSPKQMKEAHANGTQGRIGRSMPMTRAFPDLATTWATTKSRRGRYP
jgi:hypothetical protein